MEQRELSVEAREIKGSAAVRRLRRQGIVPGVIYSGGTEAKAIQVNEFNFLMTMRGCPSAQLFTLNSADSEINGEMVLVKHVQKDPIKDKVLHFDLMALKAGVRIEVEVPVVLVGESIAVKQGRVMIDQITYRIEIECLPKEIPDKLVADISALNAGDTIVASELVLPEGVVLCVEEDTLIVTALDAEKLAAAADKVLADADAAAASDTEEETGEQSEAEGADAKPESEAKDKRDK